MGLLGGSFDPPHEGHIHVSETARKALGLDCVWWLVATQNPLKARTAGDYDERLASCVKLARPCPRIVVSDLERQIGARRSIDTLRALRLHYPGTAFVFMGGTDIAIDLPRWYRWRDLNRAVAMAFVARPPALDLVRGGGIRMGRNRHFWVDSGGKYPLDPGNTYWITDAPMQEISSSGIRNTFINKVL